MQKFEAAEMQVKVFIVLNYLKAFQTEADTSPKPMNTGMIYFIFQVLVLQLKQKLLQNMKLWTGHL